MIAEPYIQSKLEKDAWSPKLTSVPYFQMSDKASAVQTSWDVSSQVSLAACHHICLHCSSVLVTTMSGPQWKRCDPHFDLKFDTHRIQFPAMWLLLSAERNEKRKWLAIRKDKKVKQRPTYIDRAPHAWWKYKSSKPPKFGNPRANRHPTFENWAIACTPSEFSTLCSRMKWTGVR